VLSEAIRLAMSGVLVVSSVAKLASPSSTRAALATFGIVGELRQRVAWTLLVALAARLRDAEARV